MQQHHDPPDLHDLRLDVTRALAAVVARALKKQPAERWQTAEEMRRALLPYTLAAG
jgi:serine/threonine-protein kinase